MPDRGAARRRLRGKTQGEQARRRGCGRPRRAVATRARCGPSGYAPRGTVRCERSGPVPFRVAHYVKKLIRPLLRAPASPAPSPPTNRALRNAPLPDQRARRDAPPVELARARNLRDRSRRPGRSLCWSTASPPGRRRTSFASSSDCSRGGTASSRSTCSAAGSPTSRAWLQRRPVRRADRRRAATPGRPSRLGGRVLARRGVRDPCRRPARRARRPAGRDLPQPD